MFMLFIQSLLHYNYIYIFVLFTISSLLYYFTKIFNVQKFYKNASVLKVIRLTLLISLLVSFFIHMYTFWVYIVYLNIYLKLPISKNLIILPKFINNNFLNLPGGFGLDNISLNLSLDFFGLILLTLAYIVGFISILALDTRLYFKNIKYIFAFNTFILIVYLYVTTSNILIFFLLYECLLLPSFLFVYFVSPSRRAIQASLYFII